MHIYKEQEEIQLPYGNIQANSHNNVNHSKHSTNHLNKNMLILNL